MAGVLQCPVCGRLPKIKHKETWSGHCVHITCKSLFGKVHEQLLVYSSWADNAYNEAIDLWNGRVKHYKEAHQDVGN